MMCCHVWLVVVVCDVYCQYLYWCVGCVHLCEVLFCVMNECMIVVVCGVLMLIDCLWCYVWLLISVVCVYVL